MAELNVNEIFSDDIIETSRRKHMISTLANDPHGQAIYSLQANLVNRHFAIFR